MILPSLKFVRSCAVKCCIPAISIWLTSAAIAAPATVTFSSQSSGSSLGTAAGQELPVGSLIRFGYFDASVQFDTMLQDLSLLNSHFTELGHTAAGYFDGLTVFDSTGAKIIETNGTNYDVAGTFAAKVTLDPALLGLTNARVFIWAYDAASAATSTAYGIFSDDAWKIPSFGTSVFELGSASPADVNDYYFATRGPQLGTNLNGELNRLTIVPNPVPEPTGAMLLVSLAGGLVMSRRRCHKEVSSLA